MSCGGIAYCYLIQPKKYTVFMGWGSHAFCSHCVRDYIVMSDGDGNIISVILDNGFLRDAGHPAREDDDIPF